MGVYPDTSLSKLIFPLSSSSLSQIIPSLSTGVSIDYSETLNNIWVRHYSFRISTKVNGKEVLNFSNQMPNLESNIHFNYKWTKELHFIDTEHYSSITNHWFQAIYKDAMQRVVVPILSTETASVVSNDFLQTIGCSNFDLVKSFKVNYKYTRNDLFSLIMNGMQLLEI